MPDGGVTGDGDEIGGGSSRGFYASAGAGRRAASLGGSPVRPSNAEGLSRMRLQGRRCDDDANAINDRADSPTSKSSGRSASSSPSPERSTPAADRVSERQRQQRQSMSDRKQPLLLHRPRRQSYQGRRQSVARPAPAGLAAAAATAAARAAEQQGSAAVTAAVTMAAKSGRASSAAENASPEAADADAVAAAMLGPDRAAGARAMRSALEDLRGERDSLANACGRLEVEREAASVKLREGAELARQLEKARKTLEAEKDLVEERCNTMEKEMEACGKGECAGATTANGRIEKLEEKISALEKERKENAEMVRVRFMSQGEA